MAGNIESLFRSQIMPTYGDIKSGADNKKINPKIMKAFFENGYYATERDGVITFTIRQEHTNKVAFVTFDASKVQGSEWAPRYHFTAVIARVTLWSGRVIGQTTGTSSTYPHLVSAIKKNNYWKAVAMFLSFSRKEEEIFKQSR